MNKRYIHLGSWNIEHLSKRGGREESVYALTEHIEMASLDVLATAILMMILSFAGLFGIRR